MVVCIGIGLYFIRFVFDAEFGDGTVYSPQFTESGFKSLRVGMSQEEVEAIMGPPLKKVDWHGSIYSVAVGDKNWWYSDSRGDGNFWRRWVIFGKGKVVAIIIRYID